MLKTFFIFSLLVFLMLGCTNSKYRNIARTTENSTTRRILLDGSNPLITSDNIKIFSVDEHMYETEFTITKPNKIDSPILESAKIKPEIRSNNNIDTTQTRLINDSTLVNINSETKKAERLVKFEYGFCMAACIALLLALISIIPLIAFSIEIFLDLCIVLVCLFIITSLVFGVIAFAKMKLLELELKNGKKLIKSFIINLLLIVLPIISIILAQLFLY